jgi:hypothetical protein
MQSPNLNIVKVLDSRLNTKSGNTYALVESSSQAVLRSYPSNSASSAQITFSNINPPSGLLVSKRFMLTVSFNIEFVGTCPAGSTLLSEWGHSIAFRNLPLMKMIKVCNLTLNKNQISTNISDDVKLHERLNFDACDWIPSPTYPDVSQDYDECTHTNSNNINPLSTNTGDKKRRGDFPCEIVSDTATNAVVRVTFSEPLYVSPLSFGCKDKSVYFAHLTDVAINLTLNELSKSLLSIAPNNPSTFTRITPTITSANMDFEYLTPAPNVPTEPVVNYAYYPITRQQLNIGAVLPNQDTTINTSTVILSSVPKMLYVLIQEDDNKRTEYSTDTYAEIKAVSITLNGRSSELAPASQFQLYALAKKNGSDITWEGFKGVHRSANSKRLLSGVGSIIAINLAEDIGLGNETPSMISTQNIQIKVTFSSLRVDQTPVNYSIYTYFVSDGVMTLSAGGGSNVSEAVVLRDALRMVPDMGADTTVLDAQPHSIGGSFSSWIKGVPGWLKQHGPALLNIAKQVAPMVGLGCDMHHKFNPNCPHCYQSGAGLIGGCGEGGGLIGGRSISKKNLKNLLR